MNKLTTYFKAFSKKDWQQFDRFIHSPFFKASPISKRFFHFLYDNRKGKDLEKITKQEIFTAVYPGIPFNDKQLRTQFWRLATLVETYLAVSEFKDDETAVDNHLIMALGKRNDWFPFFEKRIKEKIKKDIERVPDFNTGLQSVKLHHELYFHERFSKYKTGYFAFRKLTDSLDHFIALAKLKYYCEFLFRKQILREEEDHPFTIDPILEQLKTQGLQHNTAAILLYARIIQMKETDDWNYFPTTAEVFKKYWKDIDSEDQHNMLRYLINFIIHLNKKSESPRYDEMLGLYEFGLKHNMLITNRTLSYSTFTNIAVLGSIAKKFDWTDNFITDYQHLLEPSIGPLAVKLSKAFLSFHQNSYKEVLDWTLKIDTHSSQPDHPFRLRSLKLRAFFELYLQDKSYRKLLLNFAESFYKYIRQNRTMTRQQSIAYRHFVQLTKKILTYQSSVEPNEEKKQKLIDEITEKQPLVLKKWLLEKIMAL